MRQRDYFHSTARKTNHSEDWASYRCHRNRVSSATRRQRRPIIGALLIRVGRITKPFGERWKKFYLEKEKLHLQTFLLAELWIQIKIGLPIPSTSILRPLWLDCWSLFPFQLLLATTLISGRVRRYITSHSANSIFISMIRLTLEYCAGVWACCGEVNSGILETLQKRVGRIVIKTSSSDTAMKAFRPGAMNTS